MKDFFKWFKSSTRIKRWILLMIIGITLVCYGIAKLLVTDVLGLRELIKIILIFVCGFTFTIISIICIQKRTLELLVEESDTRDIKKGNNVNSLIFNKKVYNQGPKIVAIGGGSGLNTVLRGLKNYTDNITAIVTVSDYGLENKISPLDDIKDSLIALSSNEEKMNKLLNNTVTIEKKQYKFSDLYFNAIGNVIGDFEKSIEESKDVLNITGKVLPVTLDSVRICAELEDGTVIESKEKISETVNEHISKINRVYLSPTNCTVAPGVLDAIREADAIVIGPGSLYTNVIPNLLVSGVSKEIKESKAFKIYVSNIMTEFGQTDSFSLSDHIQAIIDHAGKGIIDYCIYDTGEIIPEYIRNYNKKGCELVEQDVSNVKGLGIKLIQRNLSMVENDLIRHNPDAIATTIIQLICDDLKFNDMQNNAQFIMLDSKIKDAKKRLKIQEKEQKANSKVIKNNNKGRTSKFFEKYNDRIESIRESEKHPKKIDNKKTKEIKHINESIESSKIKEEEKKITSKEHINHMKESRIKKNNKNVNKKSDDIKDISEDKNLRNILDKLRK